MKKLLCLLWALCLLPAFLAMAAGMPGFRHLDMRNGLSNNSVNHIMKDSRGFMWFSTGSGLNRYDGYSFKVFRSIEGDTLSLPDNFIEETTEWTDGQIWVRTSRGYALYDARTERFYRHPQVLARVTGGGTADRLYVDSRQRLWAYVPGQGCYRYATDAEPQTVLFSFSAHELPQSGITAMGECSEGLLLLYDNGRLVCVDADALRILWVQNRITEEMGADTYEAFSLYVDADEDIWIYGTPGTWCYSLAHRAFRPTLVAPINVGKIYIHDVKQHNDGQIWLATDNHGIFCLDKATGKTTEIVATDSEERGLPHNTVYALYADSTGVMWAGTYKKGVACYAESIYKFDLKAVGDVTFVAEGSDGTLWLGTNDRGIVQWHPQRGVLRTYGTAGGQLPSDAIVSLLQARDGTLWAGTFRGGLVRIRGNLVQTYGSAGPERNFPASDNLWSLAEDARGNLWIATLGGGLQCFHPQNGQVETYNMSNSALSENHLASICLLDDRTLLVGTSTRGVDVLDLSTRRVKSLPGLEHFSINQVYADSRGLVWVAAREGLVLYDYRNARIIGLPFMEKLTGLPVSGIVEDDGGQMWLTVSNRIINLRIAAAVDGTYEFSHRVYDSNDGVQNSDFNFRSICRLADGSIVAGGLYGINRFHPTEIRYNLQLPRVMFAGFHLFNEPVEVGRSYGGNVILPASLHDGGSVRLGYRQNVFSVFFATDNYVLPEKTSYSYRLEGFSRDWLTLPAGVNSVSFTSLAPGNYILRVRAINSDGHAGTDEAQLHIVVQPPFWRSVWAYLLYLVAFVALLVYTRHRLLTRERERFRIRQMEQEAAKNEEINQMKFRFFTNISHELRTPLTLIISPLEGLLREVGSEEQQKQLRLMHRNAQRLLGLVNQLLDFRKGEMGRHTLSLAEGDCVAYLQSVCNSFLLMAEKKRIHFSFFAGMDHFSLAFDADKLGKIVMNLLSNAFKFTPEGGRVNVLLEHIEGEQEWLELKVSDTGVGIADADKERIFERFYQCGKGGEEATGTGIGLSLVRDFVTLHGGEIRVYDNIGCGSVFVVRIPVRHVELPAQPLETEDPLSVPVEELEAIPEHNDTTGVPLILVVDDNEDFRAFMRYSLEPQYRVHTASDGQEAWRQLQTEDLPDLVISDVMMPGMDGNELCRLIKQEKRTAHLPVILLTARQATESELEGLQTGADDYVTKPFNMDVLALRVRKLIELSRARRAESGVIDPAPSNIVITSLDEKLIERAVKYVEENISRSELSVEELSRELGMSRVHLYKRLLQITGKTPIEFIRVIRLKRAAQLLRESQLHVSEVAFEVGFNNPKYFSRYFKEEFGILPSAYQEKEGK